MQIITAEAALIREAARRVLAGESAPRIARDWKAREITLPEYRRLRHELIDQTATTQHQIAPNWRPPQLPRTVDLGRPASLHEPLRGPSMTKR